jgi:hypothetical protein
MTQESSGTTTNTFPHKTNPNPNVAAHLLLLLL